MPTSDIVHRHTFSFREAIAALLPEDQVDCDSYEVRVVGSVLVLDIVNPITRAKETSEEDEVEQQAPAEEPGDAKEKAAADMKPEREKLKGGPLAARAGIICGEKAFWVFMDAATAEEAVDNLRAQCGVESRAELDHDEKAAEEFKRLDRDYRAWLRAEVA